MPIDIQTQTGRRDGLARLEERRCCCLSQSYTVVEGCCIVVDAGGRSIVDIADIVGARCLGLCCLGVSY